MLHNKLIPALLWALFILGLCALPGSAFPELTFLDWLKPDKLVHLFLFGVLSFLIIRAFSSQTQILLLRSYPKMFSIGISSIYGVLIETLQEYCIPGRYGDVFDSIADAAGAFIGIWFFNYYRKRRAANHKA